MPALNELLAPFGIAFGDAILEGQVPLEPDKPYYASGANIVRFPAGGHLHGWQLADKATEGVFHAIHPLLLLCNGSVSLGYISTALQPSRPCSYTVCHEHFSADFEGRCSQRMISSTANDASRLADE